MDHRKVTAYLGAAGLGGYLGTTDISFWGAAFVLAIYVAITVPWMQRLR